MKKFLFAILIGIAFVTISCDKDEVTPQTIEQTQVEQTGFEKGPEPTITEKVDLRVAGHGFNSSTIQAWAAINHDSVSNYNASHPAGTNIKFSANDYYHGGANYFRVDPLPFSYSGGFDDYQVEFRFDPNESNNIMYTYIDFDLTPIPSQYQIYIAYLKCWDNDLNDYGQWQPVKNTGIDNTSYFSNYGIPNFEIDDSGNNLDPNGLAPGVVVWFRYL